MQKSIRILVWFLLAVFVCEDALSASAAAPSLCSVCEAEGEKPAKEEKSDDKIFSETTQLQVVVSLATTHLVFDIEHNTDQPHRAVPYSPPELV